MANEKRLIDANALGIERCNPDLLPFDYRSYAAGWNGVVNIIENAPPPPWMPWKWCGVRIAST